MKRTVNQLLSHTRIIKIDNHAFEHGNINL